MPERTNVTPYPTTILFGPVFLVEDILIIGFLSVALLALDITCDSSTHHPNPSLSKHQLSDCMCQYPVFIITPWSFMFWFRSCSNMVNLGSVSKTVSEASVVSTILFYLVVVLYYFTWRCLIQTKGFFKAFYGGQGEFSKDHLDAEWDSFQTCQRLRLHESQRELGRSMDDINRREERQARMDGAIRRGESELRLMARLTRRIGRRRNALVSGSDV
jgi:hypothetical protein